MANKPAEAFRDTFTGKVWAANPGTPAHTRMSNGVKKGEFERTEIQPQRSSKPTKATPKSSSN